MAEVVITITIGLALLALAWIALERRERFLQRRHVANHPPCPDAEFLGKMGVQGEDAERSRASRNAMAKAAGVPADTIYSEQPVELLFALGYDGLDILDFVTAVEAELGVSVRDGAFGKKDLEGLATFADLVRLFLRNWDRAITRRE